MYVEAVKMPIYLEYAMCTCEYAELTNTIAKHLTNIHGNTHARTAWYAKNAPSDNAVVAACVCVCVDING